MNEHKTGFRILTDEDKRRYEILKETLNKGARPTLFGLKVISIQLVEKKFYISYLNERGEQIDNESIQIGEMNHLYRKVTNS